MGSKGPSHSLSPCACACARPWRGPSRDSPYQIRDAFSYDATCLRDRHRETMDRPRARSRTRSGRGRGWRGEGSLFLSSLLWTEPKNIRREWTKSRYRNLWEIQGSGRKRLARYTCYAKVASKLFYNTL
jgi:hypothetical protein